LPRPASISFDRAKPALGLMRYFSGTNMIENPSGAARQATEGVCQWRDPQMVP